MAFPGIIAGRKKSGDYLRTAYFKLGFHMGRTGIFEPGDSGLHSDEERVLLFPVGNDSAGFAGDSRRPWQERQSFGGADGDRVQKTGFHVFVHYTGGKS